jgi:hypothetical protein
MEFYSKIGSMLNRMFCDVRPCITIITTCTFFLTAHPPPMQASVIIKHKLLAYMAFLNQFFTKQ